MKSFKRSVILLSVILTPCVVSETSESYGGGGTGIRDENKRWPKVDGKVVVPYTFGYGSRDRVLKSKIKTAMRTIEQKTGCIKFVQRTNQFDYLDINDNTNDCSSHIGMEGGRQDLTLANGCMTQKTIQHELIHSLGKNESSF
jgi:hypothetical protein